MPRQYCTVIIPPNKDMAPLDNLNRGKTVEPFETQRLTEEGRSLTVQVSAIALADATGKPYAMTTIE